MIVKISSLVFLNFMLKFFFHSEVNLYRTCVLLDGNHIYIYIDLYTKFTIPLIVHTIRSQPGEKILEPVI